MVRKRHHPTIGPEPPPVDGARWIRLTQSRFALVDDDRFDELDALAWCFNAKRGVAFTNTIDGVVMLHRMVMGAEARVEIDHRNGNPLDNRRTNLRIATRTQQGGNAIKKCSARSSQYKGVHRGPNKWHVQIRISGRKTHLGCFEVEIDAAQAYDDAARREFGEFACVNFPRDGERCALAPSAYVSNYDRRRAKASVRLEKAERWYAAHPLDAELAANP